VLHQADCPICGQPLTMVGQFWICPQHGQVSQEKPFTPLRIFLSYGHDRNEQLVRRIKADLEKRGHDVWFDKSEIKFGDDWRRSITEGITGSHKFVSFLSKYSTRDPGVCLEEIAIAIGVKGGNIQTILVESEREVNPPPSISHIQWLDMHDWKCVGSAEMGQTELLVKRDNGNKDCEWNPGRLWGGIVPPASVLAPGSVLGLMAYLDNEAYPGRIFTTLNRGENRHTPVHSPCFDSEISICRPMRSPCFVKSRSARARASTASGVGRPKRLAMPIRASVSRS
jgi:hypothetical protein